MFSILKLLFIIQPSFYIQSLYPVATTPHLLQPSLLSMRGPYRCGWQYVHFSSSFYMFKIKQEAGMEKRQGQGRLKERKARKRTLQEQYKVNQISEQLKEKGNLPLPQMKKIIAEATALLQAQPNLLKLNAPLTVVGDIHGQFFDLTNIFDRFGRVPEQQYLFLGDYVDRGKFCIEVITLLLVLKICHPEKVHLLRGNHEGRTMTSFFNFKLECEKKYNSEIYERFIDLFKALPLCALIDHKYFAVHGGLSPAVKTLANIQKLNRAQEIPEQGPLCDLLWSDPIDESHDKWTANKMRSCSYYYSRNQAIRFLNANSLKLIIRGHEVQMRGFKYQQGIDNTPLTLTLFSAPKYCDSYNNKGAVAVLTGKDIAIKSFKEVEHPFVLNHYLNAFELSFPMIAVGVTKIFTHILKNPKVSKSLKPCEQVDLIEILKKIDNVAEIGEVMNINADQIRMLLVATRINNEDEVSEGLLEFIEQHCKEANERLPLIFGPKSIFVRIQIDKDSDDPIEEAE